MNTTIEDVAREAGVSIATVSRYLNGRTGEVSMQTGTRIQAVVERLGYVPNLAARSLKTGRSWLIGVLLANIAIPTGASCCLGWRTPARPKATASS